MDIGNDLVPERRRARALAAAAVVALGLLASGCGAGGATDGGSPAGTISRANKDLVESTDAPVRGGKLVYGLNAESNGWNPATNQWAPSGLEVAHAIFDTLTAFDDQGAIHPFLAESFTPNAELTEWTFRLRAGVRFSNGDPVTAEAVARNQRYLKASGITGGAYHYTESITAVDDRTVVFETSTPFASFPMVLSTQIGVVAEPNWLESNDSMNPIGTGPFVLESWELGNRLVVHRNPAYWQKDERGEAYPYLDTVEFRVITDVDSRGAALQAADIDVMQTYSGEQIQQFQKLDGYQILSDAKGEQEENFVQLNVLAPPLDDPDARRALALATDRDAVVDVITGGYSPTATGPFAPGSPWYADSGFPTYDPVQAKALVEKVKAAHGGQFSFSMVGVAEPSSTRLQQLLQQQWAAVGIDVELETVEQSALIIQVVTGQYQATTWQQFGSPNPTLDSVWWSPELVTTPPEFSLNFARNADPEIGRVLVDARATTDPVRFDEDMAVLQQRLAIDLPYLWLYHLELAIIASTRVVNIGSWHLPDGATGIVLNQGAHPLHQVWLRDRGPQG